jgi:hypothetical protein
MHDSLLGRLFVRSGWDESAAWLGFFSGELQMFRGWGRQPCSIRTSPRSLWISGRAVILFGAHTQKFKLAVEGKAAGVRGGAEGAAELPDRGGR